jgi:para-nitrobenzyl esterase
MTSFAMWARRLGALVLCVHAVACAPVEPREPPNLPPLGRADAGSGEDDAGSLGSGPDAESPALSDAGDAAAIPDETLIVLNDGQGSLRGSTSGQTRAFLGIPFAEAPVGPLRFAPPRARAPWAGVRDATAFGPDCPQDPVLRGTLPGGKQPMSEDCLSLAIWTPRELAKEPRPVIVFVPGGAFRLGSGADIDGSSLSEGTGAVVVHVNYRLGALGSLVHPVLDAALDVPSGNQALRDQQLALQWVKQHIDVFGGDPANVTLFGQSAGAQCACMQLFAPSNQGLFQRLLLMSGSCVRYPAVPMTRTGVQKLSTDLVQALCGKAEDTLACLRDVPAQDLVAWASKEPLRPLGETFSPQVDGVYLPRDPAEALAAGELMRVPVMIGSDLDEWGVTKLYGGAEVPRPGNDVELALITYGLYADHALPLLQLYRADPSEAVTRSFGRLMTDAWFTCPTRALLRGLAAQDVPAFHYSFELEPAVHGMELDYLYGIPWVSPVLTSPAFTPAAPLPLRRSLVSALQGYIGNFALSGTPRHQALPAWPPYHAATDPYQRLGEGVATGFAQAREACDLWASFY